MLGLIKSLVLRRGGLVVLVGALFVGLTVAALSAGQSAKLFAGDGQAFDQFGSAVDVSGDRVIVGANRADVSGQGDQGAAYIFERTTGTLNSWGQVARLTASDGAAGDEFGWAVSISGETAVVGAHFADVGSNLGQGAAYIFERNGGTLGGWGQVARLTASDGAASDGFGQAVAIFGDKVVIGASGAGAGDQGAAYIFERNQGGPNNWGEVTKLVASDGGPGDQFGFSVSISGETVTTGAPSASVSSFSDGAAYIFERNQGGPNNWGEVTKLAASDGATHNQFGWDLDINGDTVVVGALRGDAASSDEGAAYVFERPQNGTGVWPESAKLTASDAIVEDFFGSSVAVYSDTVIAGAWRAIIEGSPNQGAAYLFNRDWDGANSWGQVTKLTASDGAAFDGFGWAVALDEATAASGAFLANIGGNSDQGAAYLYQLTPIASTYLPIVMKNYPPVPPTPTFPCTPQRLTDIVVGNQPRGVAVDEARSRVYVANYASSSVSIIDGNSNAVITTVTHFPNISAPTGITYDSASDAIWVTNDGSDSGGNFHWLTSIDADSFEVGSPIDVGSEPWGVVFNPADDHMYVANRGDNTVSVISPTLGSVVNTIPVGQSPYNLAAHRSTGLVYVANFGSKSVSVLNASGHMFDIPLAFDSDDPFGIAVDDVLANYVYVSTVKSFRIETIDIDNGHQLLSWHEFRRGDGSGAPLRALALNPTLDTADGGHLWTTTSTGDLGNATQVLLIPKGYDSGFGQPVPDDYADPTGGGLLAAGIAVNTFLDRTYVTLPPSGLVRVFGDRDGACVKPFQVQGGITVEVGP